MSMSPPVLKAPGRRKRQGISPLVQQVLARLSEALAELEAGRPLPTEIELSEQYGVSRKTLRAAMRRLETDGAVQRVRGKGTFPTRGRTARPLFRAQAAQLGLIPWAGAIDDRESGAFYSEILKGATEEALVRQCHIVLSGGRTPAEKLEACYRLGDAARMEGLILVALTDQALLEDLAARGKPVCLVDHWSDRAPVDTVRVDSAGGSRLAVEHLVKLGHKRIAYFNTPFPETNRLRLQGYEDALKAHGLPSRPEWVISEHGADNVEGGVKDALKLLALPEAERPSAVLAFSQEMALGAIQGFMRFGLRVPEDLSVIGTGGAKGPLTVGLPALTCVRFDSSQMGRAAVRFLLDRMENPALPPRNLMLPGELDLGASTAPPKKAF